MVDKRLSGAVMVVKALERESIWIWNYREWELLVIVPLTEDEKSSEVHYRHH